MGRRLRPLGHTVVAKEQDLNQNANNNASGGLRPPDPPAAARLALCRVEFGIICVFFEPRFSSIVSRCQHVQNGPFLVKRQILGFLVVEEGLLCVALRLFA